MQLGGNFKYISNNLVYIRCGRSIVGQNEKISTIDARVGIKIQL